MADGDPTDWAWAVERSNPLVREMSFAMSWLLSYDVPALVRDLFGCTNEDVAEFAKANPRGDAGELRLGDFLVGAYAGGWRPSFNPDGSKGMHLPEGSLAARLFAVVGETQHAGVTAARLIMGLTGVTEDEVTEAAEYLGRRSPLWARMAIGYIGIGMWLAGYRPEEGDGGLDEDDQGTA